MTGTTWFRIGAALGFLAVGLGAFGAHGFKDRLELLGTSAAYQTAVQYHMFHALALLAVGLTAGHWGGTRAADVAGWSFLAGVLVFSGSLYILSLTGMKWLGAITPIGGVAMLVGWVALIWGAAGPGLEPKFAAAEGKTARGRLIRDAVGTSEEGSR